MSTAVVWFRRDLRLHDHPPLVTALREHDKVVPLFVLDERLVHGRFASANRTQYLLDCLKALDDSLDGRLVVRHGAFETEIPQVVAEVGAEFVYAAGDVSAYARARDKRVAAEVDLRLGPGTSSPAWVSSGRSRERPSRCTHRSGASGVSNRAAPSTPHPARFLPRPSVPTGFPPFVTLGSARRNPSRTGPSQARQPR